MCTIDNNNDKRISFAQDGCQIPTGHGVCGEKNTLEIVNEFRTLYEEKMRQIERTCGSDCLQEKFKLQQEWINNLTEQNELLVKAVEELEIEATERVFLLEQKLQQSARSICEVMNKYREYDVTSDILAEPLQKVFYLENDQKNLLEFVRRARENNEWTMEGLKFYEISDKDLFGTENKQKNNDSNGDLNYMEAGKAEESIRVHNCTVEELKEEIGCKENQIHCAREECTALKQSMTDMRQVLTEEVASKHDQILQLKRDLLQLEERCIQADKQTAFKDDIIKELRKEIKQLKQQLTQDEVVRLNSEIDSLQNNLQRSKQLQEKEEQKYREEISKLSTIIHDLKINLMQVKTVKTEDEKKYQETISNLNRTINEMRNNSSDHVEVNEVQVDLDGEKHLAQNHALKRKEEIIKIQADTVKEMQVELDTIKQQDFKLRADMESKCREMLCLKNKITDLEVTLKCSEEKAGNLQSAVDLYVNSINVLEASEEKYKMELIQQKSTISNLQSALVHVKLELDELKKKSEENVSVGWTARWFGSSESKSNSRSSDNNQNKPVHDV